MSHRTRGRGGKNEGAVQAVFVTRNEKEEGGEGASQEQQEGENEETTKDRCCDEGREVRLKQVREEGRRRRQRESVSRKKKEKQGVFPPSLFSSSLSLHLSLSFLNSDPTGIRCHTRLVIQHEVSHDEKSRNEMMNLSG